MNKNTTHAEIEPVLTEFVVTETYTIQAKTRDEAIRMVAENDFQYGIKNHKMKMEVNF